MSLSSAVDLGFHAASGVNLNYLPKNKIEELIQLKRTYCDIREDEKLRKEPLQIMLSAARELRSIADQILAQYDALTLKLGGSSLDGLTIYGDYAESATYQNIIRSRAGLDYYLSEDTIVKNALDISTVVDYLNLVVGTMIMMAQIDPLKIASKNKSSILNTRADYLSEGN